MTARKFHLVLHNAPTPTNSSMVKGNLVVALALQALFHDGYIEVRGRNPPRGGNPFYDDYTNLLAADDYFRFTPPGIGVGEHRESESQRLGRIVARGYLRQHHGYRWFANIDELLKTPQRGWAASARVKGNKPDWLVTRRGSAAVAEAKGTHRLIHDQSAPLPGWRAQAGNIQIAKNGKPYAFKTWIVASRWVTTDQPRTLPRIYVEDPPLDGAELGQSDLRDVELWTARTHTARNLRRLAVENVALRLRAAEPIEVAPTRRVRWRCAIPGFEERSFVGRFLVDPDAILALIGSGWWPPWEPPFPPWPHPHIPRNVAAQLMLDLRDALTFDGLDVGVVKSLLRFEVPDEHGVEVPEAVSFLPDGSLLAPGSFMSPDGVVEF